MWRREIRNEERGHARSCDDNSRRIDSGGGFCQRAARHARNAALIGGRLYFLSEITDSENGGGLLQAMDKNTLRALWKSPARISFNAGIPLITDSVAYMTGINEVGKVRLSDGKFIWKHLFLGDYEPLPGMLFNSFDTPVLENGLVRFTPDSATSHAPGALLVDDKTGVVVAPEILKGQKPACTGEQAFC